jgi:hypothetical protein
MLERFMRRVTALKESGLLEVEPTIRATPLPGQFVVGGPAWQIAVNRADENLVKAAVGDFRLVYTDSAPVSAARALRVLSSSAKRAGTSAGERAIDDLRLMRKRLQERRKIDPRGRLLEEAPDGGTIERSPEEIIDIWFNGEYFHEDARHADHLTPPDHMTVQMLRFSFQMAMRDFIAYWSRIADLAKAVTELR